ncbi:amino acid ABC transporter ATP-binding protein [Ralstonia sp.]|uniref:amino acid ABC transporter ATP-binding protein n=1 Tax=Ralstonia sp. TaxID=54061 RepID=UPI0031D24C23
MALIEVDNLKKSYGSAIVLDGVSLDVEQGEVLAIIGKSGSGKSTLLRCLNGFETPDDGAVRISGTTLTKDDRALRRIRLDIGMVFQQFNLFPHLTVGRNVMLCPMQVRGVSRADAQAQARKELQRVGLLEKFDAYPDQLSGGQQQRVAIARALAMGPKALLCDEITSALDPELVNEVLSVVRSLARDGMTLLMVTHEMRFARDVCDRVIFMHQGRVHEAGSPQELFSNPRTTELRQFLGKSSEDAPAPFHNVRALHS